MSKTTAELKLPAAFELSYDNFESYPDRLICPTSYHHAIEASKARLNAIAPKLFTSKDVEVKVVFRDLLLTEPGMAPSSRVSIHMLIYKDTTNGTYMTIQS